MNLLRNSWLLIFTILFAFVYCSTNPVDPVEVNTNWEKVNTFEDKILEVNYEELPYNMLPLADLDNTPHPKDENGIQIFEYHGENYYHPTLLTMQMSWYVDSFLQSGDSIYYHTILNYYNKVMDICEINDETIWIAYPFNYPIHGKADQLMETPWYSAMAQGTLLKIISQIYNLTGDSKYLEQAKKVFKTFDSLRGNSERWITYIDNNNFLWFEEYPDFYEPNNTLNGFLYAMFGIYEYYLITNDEHAEFLLKAGISTMREYLTQFRAEGDLSYYCIKHKEQSRYYHILHIKQIKALYSYSGDTFFKDMADLFYYDHQ